MTTQFDVSKLTSCDLIEGEDEEETVALREMQDRAEAYLKAFPWCPPIVEKYLGFGVGGVIALFLFRFATPVYGTDEWLWVVEGDLPSAYFVVDGATDPSSALAVYCQIMEDWANAVLSGSTLTGYYPVPVDATRENAGSLKTRIAFIREEIMPTML